MRFEIIRFEIKCEIKCEINSSQKIGVSLSRWWCSVFVPVHFRVIWKRIENSGRGAREQHLWTQYFGVESCHFEISIEFFRNFFKFYLQVDRRACIPWTQFPDWKVFLEHVIRNYKLRSMTKFRKWSSRRLTYKQCTVKKMYIFRVIYNWICHQPSHTVWHHLTHVSEYSQKIL